MFLFIQQMLTLILVLHKILLIRCYVSLILSFFFPRRLKFDAEVRINCECYRCLTRKDKASLTELGKLMGVCEVCTDSCSHLQVFTETFAETEALTGFWCETGGTIEQRVTWRTF